MAAWLSNLCHVFWRLSVQKQNLYVWGKNLLGWSNKGVKNGGHDEYRKASASDFVMAAQASDFFFSFYNALDTSSKKKSRLAQD